MTFASHVSVHVENVLLSRVLSSSIDSARGSSSSTATVPLSLDSVTDFAGTLPDAPLLLLRAAENASSRKVTTPSKDCVSPERSFFPPETKTRRVRAVRRPRSCLFSSLRRVYPLSLLDPARRFDGVKAPLDLINVITVAVYMLYPRSDLRMRDFITAEQEGAWADLAA